MHHSMPNPYGFTDGLIVSSHNSINSSCKVFDVVRVQPRLNGDVRPRNICGREGFTMEILPFLVKYIWSSALNARTCFSVKPVLHKNVSIQHCSSVDLLLEPTMRTSQFVSIYETNRLESSTPPTWHAGHSAWT